MKRMMSKAPVKKAAMTKNASAKKTKSRSETIQATGRRVSKARKDGGQFPRNANRGGGDVLDRKKGTDLKAGMKGRSNEASPARDEDMSYGNGRRSGRGEMIEKGANPEATPRDEAEVAGRRSRRGASRAQEGRMLDDEAYASEDNTSDKNFYDDGKAKKGSAKLKGGIVQKRGETVGRGLRG